MLVWCEGDIQTDFGLKDLHMNDVVVTYIFHFHRQLTNEHAFSSTAEKNNNIVLQIIFSINVSATSQCFQIVLYFY